MLHFGYCIHFSISHPRLRNLERLHLIVCLPPSGGDKQDKVKGEPGIVSTKESVIYSRPSLVEEASAGWRLMVDLSPLNTYIFQTKFHKEMVASVRVSIRDGDVVFH